MVKLLLVEDDMMISEIYRRKFEAAGFKVAVSVTGKDVLKKVKEEDFDLILLDIVISEMNGMDVLKELKSGGYDPEMKIIIFTSLSDLENQDRAFALGADGYILKSQFNPSKLVSEIQRRLHDFKKQHENKNGNLMEIIKKRSKNGKKKILFIEDEEIFVDLFGQKLESEGYLLKYAKNGAEGVKEAMDGDFDLIIMDMVVPGMGGKEIMERLKMEDETKNIPIVVLSASVSDEDLEEVKKMGIVDAFVKTRITPDDLVKKIDKALNK